MTFYGENNQKVELSIVNYEFPPTAFGYNKDTSDDWLEIKINIESNLGRYNHTSSIFLLYEFENLIYWLDRLSKNFEVDKWYRTVEEYFEFELLNGYDKKEKRFKIIIKENKGCYIECLANNRKLHKYVKELSFELNFLFSTYKAIKKLHNIIDRRIRSQNKGDLITENCIVKIKENFKKGYRDEKGYKIIYSKRFIRKMNYIKFLKRNIFEAIHIQIEDIKLFPFKYTNKWDEYFMSHNIRFKLVDNYIIFYIALRYESIKFIEIIKNNKYCSNYLKYDFRDLGFDDE
jgi:hypothetical protein